MIHGLAIGLVESTIRHAAGEAHAATQPTAIHPKRHYGQHAAGGSNATDSASGTCPSSADALTAASPTGEPAVAFLAQLHAAPHGPVEPQAGQEDRQCSQPAPSLGALVGAAGAGIIHAGCAVAIIAVQVVVPGAVIEQSLGAAQAGGIVDNRLRAAQTRLVAHPRLGQWPGALALLAATATASRTDDGIQQAGIAGHHQGSSVAAGSAWLQQLLQRVHALLLRGGCRLLGDDGLVQTETQSQSQAHSQSGQCRLLRGGWFSGAILQVRM